MRSPDESVLDLQDALPLDERDRLRLLAEVSESIASHPDLNELFHDLAQRLPRVVPFDYINLVLHDAAHVQRGSVERLACLHGRNDRRRRIPVRPPIKSERKALTGAARAEASGWGSPMPAVRCATIP